MKQIFLALSLSALATQASAFDQSGLYIGLTGTLAPGSVSDGIEPSESLSGGMFGGQIGYRFNAAAFLVGVEADYLWGSAEAETGNARIGIDQIGTLRATLGMPMGPFLPYLSAGGAIAQASVEDKSFLEPIQDNVHLGLTVGAGLEFALTSSISLRGEYQYITLGPMDYSLDGGVKALEYDLHAIKIGANMSF